MKQFFALSFLCLGFSAFGAAPIGTNISRYPNTNVAPSSSLLLIAVTNETPATNYNIKISDMGLQWTNTAVVTNWTLIPPGLIFLTNWANAISNYVTAATNSASVTNWITLAQPANANLTNWSLIPTGSMANVVSTTFLTNWANAISNFAVAQDVIVSNGVIVEILNASNSIAGNSFARLEVQTNAVRLGLVTNLNWTYGITGAVSSTTANLGVDAATIAMNPITGIINTNLGLNTNSGIFSVQYLPNRGSQWYSGTNGIPTTNNARAGMEFHPTLLAWRGGAVGMNVVENHITIPASNFWNVPNIGYLSYSFGSNNLVNAPNSTIAGGARNLIYTNAAASFIGGGSNNVISTNCYGSVIVGGGFGSGGNIGNEINVNSFLSFIGGGSENQVIGGSQHAVIAGGQNNEISSPSSHATIGGGNINTIGNGSAGAVDACNFSTISGGAQNQIRGEYVFIGGGRLNNIAGNESDYGVIAGGQQNTIGTGASGEAINAFIGGGLLNVIADGADYAVISGGRANNILGSAGTNSVIAGGAFNTASVGRKFVSILGGERNTVDADYGFAIGTSNSVTGARAGAMGVEVTNTVADTLMLEGITRIFRRTNATLGGTIIGVQTPVASAGAAETNLIAVTIPAHTLTNTGDRVTFRTTGRFAATAENKDIKVAYGSETILDTTAQLVNGGAWTFEGEIIRTGNTSQSVNAEFHGAGVTLFTTAASLDLVQTNGINTTLKVTSTAASDGAVTNRTMTVWLWPSP